MTNKEKSEEYRFQRSMMKLSQENLAKKLGVDLRTVQRREKGTMEITNECILALRCVRYELQGWPGSFPSKITIDLGPEPPPHPPINSYGRRLKAAREKLGLSRRQAVNKWKLNYGSMCQWEHGHCQPTGLYREKLDALLQEIEEK